MSVFENHARTLYTQHQYADALNEYYHLLEQKPQDDNLMIMIGNCLDSQGDKLAAIEWYQKARRLNPQSVLALTNLATALYETGDYSQALKYSRQALKIDSKSLAGWINQGNVLYQQKQFTEALAAYHTAFEINPKYYIAAVNLANTYLDFKNYNQAAHFARLAVELDSQSVTAYTILGNACLELEHYTDSLSAFQRASELDSEDYWLQNYLSQVWQKLENWEEAFAAGWKALQISHGEDSQQINFGYLLYESSLESQNDLLKNYAHKWLETYPYNPVVCHMGNAVLNYRIPSRANDEYLKNIFDVFAPDFEQVLTGLDYQAPNLIRSFLEQLYTPGKKTRLRILDAGCGTGFCGEFLKKYSRFWGLYGVDISEKMLEQARLKKCYHKLILSELETFFKQNKKGFDLIVSADVFTYFGGLEILLSGIADSLNKNGRVVFTVTENDVNSDAYFLHSSGRYLHSENYVKKVLHQTGLTFEKSERSKLRNEGANVVYGYLFSAVKQH